MDDTTTLREAGPGFATKADIDDLAGAINRGFTHMQRDFDSFKGEMYSFKDEMLSFKADSEIRFGIIEGKLSRMDAIEDKLGKIDAIESKLGRMDVVEGRLTTIEERIETLSHDTALGFRDVDERLESLEESVRDLKNNGLISPFGSLR